MDTLASDPTLPQLAGVLAQPIKLTNVRSGIARLLEYARNRYIALPPHATIELVEHPPIIAVPGAAAYAHGLMPWQGVWLPMIDLASLLHGPTLQQHALSAQRYALVVAYQAGPRQALAQGAIGLNVLPQFTAVTDDMQCEWPDDNPRWKQLALSCFRHEGHAVPILDSSRLFSRYHETLTKAQDANHAPA